MDREEYKTKLDEARELLAKGSRDEAFDLLDNMNWRKVHNVNALLNAAEIYEGGDKLSQARELLEIAHERSPIGRMVIYRLALICIRLEAFDEAKEFYDEFVEIAPHDSLKYVIKYRLNKAKGADDLTLISILEEMKAHDFHEEWAYELALLYHKTGQSDKCIAACDEIILWFGEGPYVESALELKLLYHPLDADQENKYRAFRSRKDGVTEIRPGENGAGGEIFQKPIEIPEVAVTNEKFNTVNLQEAIKKNIEEIMKASEAGEVTENLEAIKELVGDLPFVKPPTKDPTEELPVIKAEAQRIGDTLKMNFKEYLEEEYDGQMSIFVPDAPEVERQIAGQMTIDEIMEDWERTSRAAASALEDAEAERLRTAKEKALAEANLIMGRLEDAKPQLDAGVAPVEYLKNEYLGHTGVLPKPVVESQANQSDKPAEKEKKALKAGDTFRIPKVAVEGEEEGVGFEIPVVDANGYPAILADTAAAGAGAAGAIISARPDVEQEKWKPQELQVIHERAEVVEPVEAVVDGKYPGDTKRIDKADMTKIVAGANDLLQKTLDQYGEEPVKRKTAVRAQEITIESPKEVDVSSLAASVSAIMDEPPRVIPKEQPREQASMQRRVAPPDAFEDEPERKPEAALDEMLAKASPVLPKEPVVKEKTEAQPKPTVPEKEQNLSDTKKQKPLVPDELPHKDSTTDLRKELEEKIELQQSGRMPVIEVEEPIQTQLTKEEKEIFTYFTPIGGMEMALCQVLTSARRRLTKTKGSQTGNIIVQGASGSGKTTLATSLVRVLQMETGKPNRNIGRIDGENLNTKDIAKLFSKLYGGCLIIEKAGGINRETTMEMSAVMEHENTDILVILEDARNGMEKVLGLNPQFARKFTEKIIIPVLTIDELVNFGKAYATDLGYSIDEMGVLALYDRINLIQRLDHPTNLTEVKEIVDEAIDKAERGGLKSFFNRKRRDDDGNVILQERDFQTQ